MAVRVDVRVHGGRPREDDFGALHRVLVREAEAQREDLGPRSSQLGAARSVATLCPQFMSPGDKDYKSVFRIPWKTPFDTT